MLRQVKGLATLNFPPPKLSGVVLKNEMVAKIRDEQYVETDRGRPRRAAARQTPYTDGDDEDEYIDDENAEVPEEKEPPKKKAKVEQPETTTEIANEHDDDVFIQSAFTCAQDYCLDGSCTDFSLNQQLRWAWSVVPCPKKRIGPYVFVKAAKTAYVWERLFPSSKGASHFTARVRFLRAAPLIFADSFLFQFEISGKEKFISLTHTWASGLSKDKMTGELSEFYDEEALQIPQNSRKMSRISLRCKIPATTITYGQTPKIVTTNQLIGVIVSNVAATVDSTIVEAPAEQDQAGQ